jgi:hypothetical protein
VVGNQAEGPPKRAFESGGSSRKAPLSPSKARGHGVFRHFRPPEPTFPGPPGAKIVRSGARRPGSQPRRGAVGTGRGCLAPENRHLRLPGLAIGCRQNHPSTILLIRRAKVVFVFRQMISFSNAKSLHAAFDETASI